jgi:PAS domain S-box-containing protein
VRRPLRLLLVEDDANDAELVLRELRRGGFEPDSLRVETAGAMIDALATRRFDVVLSDFRLPTFSAPAALEALHATGLDLPFIIISGTIGEETAVTAMKAGAHDFVLKQDLARLCAAVDRELGQAELRRRGREVVEALAASEERYRHLYENAPIGIYRTTPDGRILLASPALVEMLGFESFEQLAPLSLEEGGFGASTPRTAFKERLEREETVRGMESTWLRRDGTPIYVRENARAVRGDNGAVVWYEGTVEDITEQKHLEEQLRHAQKMEAVGRLAGGVAHDFNNLLQAALTTVQLLRLGGQDPRERDEQLAELEEHFRRGAQLARQLLLFSRREAPRPERLDLVGVVEGAVRLLQRLIPASVRLIVEIAGRPLRVEGDRGQLEQVLMNLVVNAVDAMPKGGKLTIRAGREGPRAVWFEVADTGAGIPEEIRERLFEPFFTTKDPGKGTGLGLSVVHGIVTQHNGRIEVEGRPGRGATFRVVLPCSGSGAFPAVPAESTAQAAVAEPSATFPGSPAHRIMVVDDSPAIRALFEAILAREGHEVVVAASAEEALEQPASRAFDLLLTDLTLPGTSGLALAGALRDRWPDLAVVVVSGQAEDEALREAARGRVRFLQKPVAVEVLLEAVRAALGGS